MLISIKAYSKEAFKKFHDFFERKHREGSERNQYIYDSFEYKGIYIDFYTTFTIVVKTHIDIDDLIDQIPLEILVDKKNIIGQDEVGTGENFGPIVVCGVLMKNMKSKEKLMFSELGIKDSKKMNFQQVLKAASEIKKNTHSYCEIVDPKKFNVIYPKIKNIKIIMALLHYKVFSNLKKIKNDGIVIDKFVSKEKFTDYLKSMNLDSKSFENEKISFIEKADSKFFEVSCAAVLAKNIYNDWLLKELSKNNTSYEYYMSNQGRIDIGRIWANIKSGKLKIKNSKEFIKNYK